MAPDKRATQLADAAEKRGSAGVGTDVEIAQARQLLAQTRVVERVIVGQANAASVSLAAALNMPPTTRIKIRSSRGRLPDPGSKTMDRNIKAAFANRPEVLASIAQVRAAQYDLEATAASYLPKIYTGANLNTGNGGLSINGFEPGGIGNTSATGIFLGVTVPIYDGKVKKTRTQNASDRLAAARLGVSVSKAVASREVGLAYEALRTSLAVYAASQELVAASSTTANAAGTAYAAGISPRHKPSLTSLAAL